MKKNIYWIVRMASDNYRVFMEDKNARPYIETLNLLRSGKSLSEIWEPVFLTLYQGDNKEKDGERNKPVPDFANGVLGFSMNENAYSVMKSLIDGQAIFLQFNTEVGTYYELDIQKINCIDLENSKNILFPSGKIMRVEKYKLYLEQLKGVHIFEPLNIMLKPIFVSNQFKDVVEKNNLTGLTFHPVPLVDE
jgi:hypothetical protein